MTFSEYINGAWVSILLAGMCFYYAWLLLEHHEIDKVRLKGSKAIPKNVRKAYARADGQILLGTGIGFTVVAILHYVYPSVCFILSILLFLVFIVLWKKVYDTYE